MWHLIAASTALSHLVDWFFSVFKYWCIKHQSVITLWPLTGKVNTDYLFIVALVSGWDILDEHLVLKVYMWEAGKNGLVWGFERVRQGQTCDGQITESERSVGCSQSAVDSTYQKWSKKGGVVNQRQGCGRPRFTDACGEWRPARVPWPTDELL